MAKKNKTSKKTVNVAAVKKEVAKLVREAQNNSSMPGPLSQSHAELPAGAVPRESPLEQEIGTNKYRGMIHDHNEKNKHVLDRLPFTFPKKKIVRSHLNISLECPKCGAESWGSENTVGFVCNSCKKYVNAKNPEAEARGYNPELVVGFRGTIGDRLDLKEELKKKKEP